MFLDINRDNALREVIDLVIRIGSCGFSEGNLLNGDHRFAVKRSHRVLEVFDGGDMTGGIDVNGNRCGLSVNCHCLR